MTRQELLDEIARRSRAGLFPSRSDDGERCMYRGPGGRACFAGLPIPDEKYRSDLEGLGGYLMVEDGTIDPDPELTPYEWSSLQRVHDRQPADPALWDHDKVMAEVLALPCFAGMVPTSVEAASCT